MRRLLFALVLPLVLACDDTMAGPVEPLEEATVATTNSLTFTPATVNLLLGGEVTWSFNPVGHNVTFTPATGVPASIPTSFNATISRTFNSAGIFAYRCTLHPSTMTGTIIVHGEQ